MKSVKIIIAATMITIGQFSQALELKGYDIPTAEQLGAQTFCYYTIKKNKTVEELYRLASTPFVQWTEDEKNFFERATFGAQGNNEKFISGFKKSYEDAINLCGEVR